VRTARTSISICALALAAAALGACGSDDEENKGRPIPASQVTALDRELDAIQRRLEVGGGACGDIETRSRSDVDGILAQVPQDVDPEVRDSLQRSFERLFELAASQCDEEKGQDTTPTETEQTPTIPTVPTEPETTPTETDQQQTDEEPGGKKPKKEKNRGGGQGQGPPAGNDGGALVPEDD
jgi:hypothetical protein